MVELSHVRADESMILPTVCKRVFSTSVCAKTTTALITTVSIRLIFGQDRVFLLRPTRFPTLMVQTSWFFPDLISTMLKLELLPVSLSPEPLLFMRTTNMHNFAGRTCSAFSMYVFGS